MSILVDLQSHLVVNWMKQTTFFSYKLMLVYSIYVVVDCVKRHCAVSYIHTIHQHTKWKFPHWGNDAVCVWLWHICWLLLLVCIHQSIKGYNRTVASYFCPIKNEQKTSKQYETVGTYWFLDHKWNNITINDGGNCNAVREQKNIIARSSENQNSISVAHTSSTAVIYCFNWSEEAIMVMRTRHWRNVYFISKCDEKQFGFFSTFNLDCTVNEILHSLLLEAIAPKLKIYQYPEHTICRYRFIG